VKKIIIIAMLLGILLLSLTGIVSAQENTIKIGLSVALSGGHSYEGKRNLEGVQVWTDWVNSHGGIAVGDENYQVEIVYYDDESDPITSAKLTEKLITQDGVDFLIGPYSSAITFATSSIAEKYDIITMSGEANAATVYERGYKNLFSCLAPAAMIMRPIADMIVSYDLDPAPKTVAIIASNDLWPLDIAEGFREACEELGLEVITFEKYPSGSTDITSLLSKVKSMNPDIVANAGYTVDCMMVLSQCKEIDFNPKIYAFGVGINDQTFLQEMGKDAEYAVEAEWWVPDYPGTDEVFGTTENFVQACKNYFGSDFEPNYHVSTTATSLTLLKLAIEKADSIKTEKVREALRDLDVELTTWMAIKFDERGQNLRWQHPVIQVQNGEIVVVYPESDNALIYPAPEWKNR